MDLRPIFDARCLLHLNVSDNTRYLDRIARGLRQDQPELCLAVALTDPRVAVAYLRVSTEEQALGPQAKRNAVLRWAEGAGVRVVAECIDQGDSGGAEVDGP
jgi:hypothetical protein